MDLPCGAAAPHLLLVAAGVGGLLVIATLVGLAMRLNARFRRLGDDVVARTIAGWFLAVVVFSALVGGQVATVVLFGLISFLALREFVTLAPTRRADHHTLFWAFFVILPLQYVLIGCGWYGMATVFVPVWAFLFVALRSTLTGDAKHYLQRAATIQWGLMLCVYCISHVPMLFLLQPPGFTDRQAELILWLMLVVELGDVLQDVWGRSLGRHRIAPHLSPDKTWEGFLGGSVSAAGLGCALWWLTPYTPLMALAMAGGAACLGFAGGVVMAAIKRDAGVKDIGHLLPGHGGILERIDSLCFAAPVVFHLTRFYWS